RFWQAVGLMGLCWILFGGLRGFGMVMPPGRDRTRDGWASLTPEERERFRRGVAQVRGVGADGQARGWTPLITSLVIVGIQGHRRCWSRKRLLEGLHGQTRHSQIDGRGRNERFGYDTSRGVAAAGWLGCSGQSIRAFHPDSRRSTTVLQGLGEGC